jgi:hypothetical protein
LHEEIRSAREDRRHAPVQLRARAGEDRWFRSSIVGGGDHNEDAFSAMPVLPRWLRVNGTSRAPVSSGKRLPPRHPMATMRNRCLPIVLLSIVACVPIVQADMPNGDHSVTTYVRLQGFEEARNDNLWVARQTCKGGVVLIEERDGVDEHGRWDRLVYGCLADERAAASAQNEKKPPP